MADLGRLERVKLREVWKNEAEHFTPWLAQEDNLKLLGETLGLQLELESQEKEVGPFRADILCKDAYEGSWVLIENQLERTDHTHLGQLMTYAAGLDTVTIVWVAERFTEEHRAALDWLNEITEERFSFFGLEVELWRIGSSEIAPKFNVVSKPNNWTRSVRKSTRRREMTEYQQIQFEFWTAFAEHMKNKSSMSPGEPGPRHWMGFPMNRVGFHLAAVAYAFDIETGEPGPELRVDLSIKGPNAKANYELLKTQQERIESKVGQSLLWVPPQRKTKYMYRIALRKKAEFSDQKTWPEHHEWLRENLEKMYTVFKPLIEEHLAEEKEE
jgi:hypothetical protein